MWLYRYPTPTIIFMKSGMNSSAMNSKKYLIINGYRINAKCATREHPQENSILEMIHQEIDNLVQMFD